MTMKWGTRSLLALAVVLATQQMARADDSALGDVTAQDLLKLLVDEGLIDKSKLKTLAEKIKARQQSVVSTPVAPAAGAVAANTAQKPPADPNAVRVQYVPQYIKDEIRDQVRMGLKDDVSRDVLAQAKTERWGLPGVVPDWVERIKFFGDIRLREESILYDSGNSEGDYLDLAHINSVGSYGANDDEAFLNTTDDRNRLRTRFRLGTKAKVTDGIEIGARLVTGNANDPISTNQTLGNYGKKWQTAFDLAYLRYTSPSKALSLSGGRIENPFLSTDLVWDSDLTFEGLAGTWWPLRSDNNLDEEFRAFDPFVTVGAFPLQEVERGEDKWLYAAQAGFQYDFDSQNKLTAALAYYAYDHIAGKLNDVDHTSNDYTAPGYVQKGNTMFDIRNVDANSPNPNAHLFAHAADYDLVDLFLEYDIAKFAPIHVLLTANYVKNIGYDKDEVARRTGFDIAAKTEGYQLKAMVGWPTVTKARDWQLSFTYRYLERDAVLAEFTDSDFHQGGTDAKGYILRLDYGIANNTWVGLRWLSSDEVDGNSYPQTTGYGTGKLGIDMLQVDLNSKF